MFIFSSLYLVGNLRFIETDLLINQIFDVVVFAARLNLAKSNLATQFIQESDEDATTDDEREGSRGGAGGGERSGARCGEEPRPFSKGTVNQVRVENDKLLYKLLYIII